MAWALLGLFFAPHVLPAAESQVPERYDLEACIEKAVANHPALKAGEARRATAQALAAMKKAERSPRIYLQGDVGHLYGKAITPFAVIRGVTEEGIAQRSAYGDFYRTVIGLDAPIFEEGTLCGLPSRSMRLARLGVTEEEWKGRDLRLQVALAVAEAYFSVLKSDFAARTHERIVTLFQGDFELAQARFAQELLSKNDLLLADVRLATARRELFSTQVVWKRSRKELVSALGLDYGQEIDIRDIEGDPGPLPPVEELVSLGRENHPEVKAKLLEVQAREEEVEKARSERFPSLHVKTQYGFANDFTGDLEDQFIAQLEMKVPIFDFGLIEEKIAMARAKVMEEEAELREVRRKIAREIEASVFGLQDLEQEEILLEKQLEQAKEAVKLNQALLGMGLVSEAVVNESQAAVLKLEIARREAKYDRSLARFRLALASGEEYQGGGGQID